MLEKRVTEVPESMVIYLEGIQRNWYGQSCDDSN